MKISTTLSNEDSIKVNRAAKILGWEGGEQVLECVATKGVAYLQNLLKKAMLNQ